MEHTLVNQSEKSNPSTDNLVVARDERKQFVTIVAEFMVGEHPYETFKTKGDYQKVIVKMTQHYDPKYEHGHYWAVAETVEGHILAGRTLSGAVHEGRITIADCAEFLQRSL